MSVVKSVDVRASKMIEKKKTFILNFKNAVYSQIVHPSPRLVQFAAAWLNFWNLIFLDCLRAAK